MSSTDYSKLQHRFIGPSWQRNEDGSWHLPERTLGWQLLGWATRYLLDLGGSGEPLRLTPEQARIVLWWYAVDENGEFAYRRGLITRVKGWGKDPLLSIIVAMEFIGPCRFSHWGPDGQPVGKPLSKSWVQVVATSQDQNKNLTDMLPVIFSRLAIEEFGIKFSTGGEITRARQGRSKIEAVASNPRSLEGNRPTFAVINEPHQMVSGNRGIEVYRVVGRNLTKTGARLMCITNAYQPGENSVAEQIREGMEKIWDGRASNESRWLYDSIEADPATPLTAEALREVLPIMRGDSYWLDPEPIIADVMDPANPPSQSRRFYLNQIAADEEQLHTEQEWRYGKTEERLEPGDRIVLGFDGSKTRDSTALVGIRVRDGLVQLLGLWERPDQDLGLDEDGMPVRWQVPRSRVDETVKGMMRLYDVVGFYSDVAYWESYVTQWEEAYGDKLVAKATGRSPIAWDMRGSQKRSTMAHHRLMSAMQIVPDEEPKLRFSDDKRLRRHILNARRRENDYGVYFGKESPDSPNKIDAYAAMMLAHEALTDYRTGKKPEPKKQRTGRAWFL